MTVLEFRHFVARAEALRDAREKERAELDAMRR